jgi:hypothetical protein
MEALAFGSHRIRTAIPRRLCTPKAVRTVDSACGRLTRSVMTAKGQDVQGKEPERNRTGFGGETVHLRMTPVKSPRV